MPTAAGRVCCHLPLYTAPWPRRGRAVVASFASAFGTRRARVQVRVLSFIQGEGRAAFGTPLVGEPHLPPFLLPTATCDSAHPRIVELAKRLIPPGCSTARAAAAVRAWVRAHIVYTLQDKSDTASATLEKREGMCTNKANLQVRREGLTPPRPATAA